MFILDGRSLALDTPFTTWDGTQYPANWLRLASPEERSNIGIYESIDPIPYDQAFYWGWDNDNKLIPKDHAQLVQQWVATVKQTANTLLADTGWYIERLNDPSSGKPVPQSVLDRRAEIRDLSNAKEDAIVATSGTDELAAYVRGLEFHIWSTPSLVAPGAEEGSTSAAGITALGLAGGTAGEDTITFFSSGVTGAGVATSDTVLG
jgi:hypothetical protein